MGKTAKYWQSGEAIDYRNSSGEVIPANAIVLIGGHIGVAGGEIGIGEVGTLHMTGVFELPKKAAAELKMGDDVVYTEDDGIDKATDAVMGYVVEDAAAAAKTVKVKLMG